MIRLDVMVQPQAGRVAMPEQGASIGKVSDALPALRDDLVREYGTIVPAGTIEQVAKQALAEFDDVPIREFVPVLAWRRARSRLRGTL
jgi:hypothetical protein